MLLNETIYKFTSVKKAHDQALTQLNRFSNQVIRKRIYKKGNEIEKCKSRKKTFLDLLLDIKTESGQLLPFDTLKDEVNTFIFAGHDTTASALIWVFYNLGLHQDIQVNIYKYFENK